MNAKPALGRFTVRACALCGKTQAQGESLMACSLLIQWAIDAKIKLKKPASRYLSPPCANKVRKQLMKKGL
jgi:hypothetical protein